MYSLAFAPSGRVVASGSDDTTIKIWDVVNGHELRTLYGHISTVMALTFSPDGRTLASAGFLDRSIRLWDVETGRELAVLKGHSREVLTVAFSPDGKSLASSGRDGTIRLWDVATGRQRETIGTPTTVWSVAFSPDGERLFSGCRDGSLKNLEVATGNEIETIDGHSGVVWSVAVSPDGRLLASGSADGSIGLWDVSSGKVIPIKNIKTAPVRSVSFSPDGRILSSGGEDRAINLWDMKTGIRLRSLRGHPGWVTAIAFSPRGDIVASGSLDRSIRFWSPETGDLVQSFEGHTNSVYSLAFSSDGRTLASGGSGGKIRLWQAAAGQEALVFSGHLTSAVLSLAFSPNESLLASGGLDKSVRIWDVSSGSELNKLSAHDGGVNAVSFSNDGKMIASGSDDKTIVLWNVATGKEIKRLKQAKPILWSTPGGRKAQDLKGNSGAITSVAFSPDRRTVASGGDDLKITLWDVASGAVLRSLEGHRLRVVSLAFSADGKTLASGSWDKTIKLWDVQTGVLLRSISALNSDIVSAVGKTVTGYYLRHPFEPMSSSGKLQAKPGKNGVVDLFQTASGMKGGTLIAMKSDGWLVTTPSGYFDGSPDGWKQLIWRLDGNTFNYAPVEAFFKEFYRPGLLAEIMSGNVPEPPSKPISEIDIRQPDVRIASVGGQSVPEQKYSLPAVLGEPVTKRDVEVRIEVIDNKKPKTRDFHPATSGAKDLRLFRNGSLVKIWRGDVFAGAEGCRLIEKKADDPRRAVCTTNVTITSGKTEFSAYAFNHEDVKSRDAVAEVTGTDKLKRAGTLYILALGVNKYSNEKFDLKYAVNDVEEIGKEISGRQALLKRYARTEIVKLTDETATKENIEEAIRRFSSESSSSGSLGDPASDLTKIRPAGPEDALVVYFAGHGKARCFYDSEKKRTNCDRFYLIPSDGFPEGEFGGDEWQEKMYSSSISDEDLERLLEMVDAGKLLMVIDACDSGQALEAEEKRRGPMNSKGLAQLAYEKGMLILTASKSQQAALETERLGHGLLTYALLEGLTKAEVNNEKVITARSWLDYAVKRVPELEREEFEKRNVGVGVAAAKKKDPDAQSPRVFYKESSGSTPLPISVAN